MARVPARRLIAAELRSTIDVAVFDCRLRPGCRCSVEGAAFDLVLADGFMCFT
jgi:hypothetical protein